MTGIPPIALQASWQTATEYLTNVDNELNDPPSKHQHIERDLPENLYFENDELYTQFNSGVSNTIQINNPDAVLITSYFGNHVPQTEKGDEVPFLNHSLSVRSRYSFTDGEVVQRHQIGDNYESEELHSNPTERLYVTGPLNAIVTLPPGQHYEGELVHLTTTGKYGMKADMALQKTRGVKLGKDYIERSHTTIVDPENNDQHDGQRDQVTTFTPNVSVFTNYSTPIVYKDGCLTTEETQICQPSLIAGRSKPNTTYYVNTPEGTTIINTNGKDETDRQFQPK